jgi:hypothetical protein
MKVTQIVLGLVALAAAAVGTATQVDVIHVPANLHDYVQYGADGVAVLALLGALAPFAFRRKSAAAVAAPAATTPAYKLRKQELRGVPGSGKFDKVEIKVPADVVRGAKGDAAAPAVAVPAPAAKKTVDPNAWVVYQTSEGANGKVALLVEAGPKVSGNGSVWHDKIWQPKLQKVKNVTWADKQKGDGKFKRRGTVSKENLADVIAAIEAVNK